MARSSWVNGPFVIVAIGVLCGVAQLEANNVPLAAPVADITIHLASGPGQSPLDSALLIRVVEDNFTAFANLKAANKVAILREVDRATPAYAHRRNFLGVQSAKHWHRTLLLEHRRFAF